MGDELHTIATFDHRTFPAQLVGELKGNVSVSVCIPARDEERTVGGVIAAVRDGLVDRLGLVDEIVVIDDGSKDGTARAAHRAGARVVESVPGSSAAGDPRSLGKGGAMRRAVEVTSGDLVVFLDADVTNLKPHFVIGLIGPLLSFSETYFVKGFYSRPVHGNPTGGGRVTELCARPVISLLFPELSDVLQPLAGETAARRSVLTELEFDGGYGVEMGMLIDVCERLGTGAIAQVDLGVRIHRNRPLNELAPQAREVLTAALSRGRVITA